MKTLFRPNAVSVQAAQDSELVCVEVPMERGIKL